MSKIRGEARFPQCLKHVQNVQSVPAFEATACWLPFPSAVPCGGRVLRNPKTGADISKSEIRGGGGGHLLIRYFRPSVSIREVEKHALFDLALHLPTETLNFLLLKEKNV